MDHATDVMGFKDAVVLLVIAGVVIPVLHRFRINPILGFLGAGILLGPHGLGSLTPLAPWLTWVTIAGRDEISVLAELGVVFLLFIVGLELSFRRLKTLRWLVFGLGSVQVLVSATIIGAIAWLFDNSAAAAAVIGLALALSSTAIVVDLLAREKRLTSHAGRTSFAVLMMQDFAVVPTLFLVGTLARDPGANLAVDLIWSLAQGAAMIAAIVVVGRVGLSPFFRLVAKTPTHDVFVAATLLVIVVSGVLAAWSGMSMALGGFVAGILLAETEYRRAIESAIEPFKGLLMGIFFFTVGMAVDLSRIIADPILLPLSVLGLVAVKAAVMLPAARAFGVSLPAAIESALVLAGGGEFAFVVFGLAERTGVIDADVAGFMLLVTAATMLVTPMLEVVARGLARRWEVDPAAGLGLDHPIAEDATPRVLVIGYGRVGALVSEMLAVHDVSHLIVEQNTLAVTRGRTQGRAIYYGNATDLGFLRRCGVERVNSLVITIGNHEAINHIVAAVRSIRSEITIVARAKDAAHARELYAEGVGVAVPETVEASLQLSEAALVANGIAMGPAIASIHERRDQFRRELRERSPGVPLT
ncbi:MAG: potassium transporter TrkA [Alphaproteobacteria bacterium]|nr:potassium transporter TrkA [Alphaproteobacteria bacterium]